MFAAWYVLHEDISFPSDIARDFLLLQEIDQKKLILIGPRSSTTGLFHGPLWLYINYPAYLLGGGNPVVVGWFWVFLIICSLIPSFFVAKNLFNETVGYFFILMLSLYYGFHARGLFNPHGALFLLPIFFFFFIRYIETFKIYYLVIHLLTAAAMIQFQMAVGIPFLLLSFVYIAFRILRSNKKKHLLGFLLILIPLGNFLIFDFRHDHLLSRSVLNYLSPQTSDSKYNYLSSSQLINRIKLLTSGPEIVRQYPGHRNLVAFIVLIFFIFVQIKNNKYRTIYISFLYFYIGFFLLSLANKGIILHFYFFPLFSLVFLIFSSFITSKYKKIFILIFFVIFALNLQAALNDIKTSVNIIGRDQDSWKFLYNLSLKVYQGSEKEFGYFVYAPDVFAYEPKYAMLFVGKLYKKPAYSFQKKPVTYLIIAPPPPDNPYMRDEWWRINQIKITTNPQSVIKFENGYKIEKYLLNEKEMQIPFDPNINPGLHFR